MFKNKLNYKLLNILMLVIIIAIGFETFHIWGKILDKLFSILLPFVISFSIAYALYPCTRKLQSMGVRKSLSNLLVVSAVVCIIVLLFSITIPLVYQQLITLSRTVGEVINDVSLKFELDLGAFQNTINASLDKIIKNLGEYVSNGAVSFLSDSINIVTNIIIVGIVSIYFLVDMEKIRLRIKTILKRFNKRTFKYFKAVDNELGNYLLGLVIFMTIQLFEYSILFLIIGHPNWLLLGILASVTTIIPYFGALATNIIAVIVASVISPKLFIATIIVCLVFPNVDGYIISPKVYGKTNNINPIWTIFAVVAGGALYGFLGILVALPIYIILNCTYNFFKKDIYGKIDNIL